MTDNRGLNIRGQNIRGQNIEEPAIAVPTGGRTPPVGYRVARLAAVLAVLLVVSWITGCMERMFYIPSSGPTPPPSSPPGVELVEFDSDDGTRLAGWFIPAQGIDPDADGPAPTVLHVHGNAGNVESHQPFTEPLPPAGFNVFLFDYRGYGQSDGSPWRRADLIADTNAALDHVLQRDDVDPDRVGVYGQSLGAAIAINVMADRSELKAGVFESPFASWRRIAANAIGGDPPNAIARGLAAILIPDHHRADDAIADIERPILLLHGDQDSIIPITHSRMLKQAGGDNVELIELPGGDHNTLLMTHPEIGQTMAEFFDEQLRGNRH